jgi:uncharacterized Zn-binding protein involved in type VI secretion
MKPAARVGDQTAHGFPLAPGPGSPNVLIGNRPAWRATLDQHACPAVNVSGADGVGSVLVGSPTVLINNQMACRVQDIVVEKPGAALGPTNPIVMGCPTVLIGEGSAASQMGLTIDALLNAAKSGLPLIQICPECRLLAALAGMKLGDQLASATGLYDAIRTLLHSHKAYSKALQFGPDNPLTALKKATQRATQFDWKSGALMGAVTTALNNLGDLQQGRVGTFAAKVGYGAARGVVGEAVGALAAKGGAGLGTLFPPAGGALGGSAIGKTAGSLIGRFIGGERGERIGAKIGGVAGAIVGAVAGIFGGPPAGLVLGAIGGKMWGSDLTEKGLDKLTGGEERVAEWLTGRQNPAPPHRSP